MSKRFAFVAGLLLLPLVAAAQPRQGDFEITLAGGGNANKDVESGNFTFNGSFGYFLTKEFEISLRQSFTYADFNDNENWIATTSGAIDYHFDLGRWQPFIGGNIGYVYSDSVDDTWQGGPEAGVKYYVTEAGRTFIFGIVSYEFFFRDGEGEFEDAQFIYSFGIGFNLP